MEERNIELLSPLAEPKCKDNPAIRDNLSSPVAEKDLDRLPINPQTKRFDKSAFIYEEGKDCYYCPAGQELPRSGNTKKKGAAGKVSNHLVYTCYDCAGCPLADRCRANPKARKGRTLSHDAHDAARRRHRVRMKTDESKERYKRRQHVGETPFAVIKTCFSLRRFLLRGIESVQTEWLWHATAFNLKRLLSLLSASCAQEQKIKQAAIV